MWSLSVQPNQDNPDIKMFLARLRITRPGQVAEWGVKSSAEQALNSLVLQMRAFFHQKKAFVWFFSYWLWALVKFHSVLFPIVTHPLKCQTLTGGKKTTRFSMMALIKRPPTCRWSKQGENLTSAFLPWCQKKLCSSSDFVRRLMRSNRIL